MITFLQFLEAAELPERAVINTPAFKRWFAGSKVVDEHGKPRVMYHGSHRTDEISSFRGFRGVAGHFAFSPTRASEFSDYHVGSDTPDPRQGVIPVYLHAVNIFDIRDPKHQVLAHFDPDDVDEDAVYELLEHPDSIRDIKEAGFDAYFDFERSANEDPTGIAVFQPEQIKSAIGNSTFDPHNPNFMR